MRDTAILLLNLGGPVNLDQVEPFLAALFGYRDLIRLPGPAWLQGPFARLIARLRAPGAKDRYAQIGGGSPLLRESAFQAAALRSALRAAGRNEPVKLCFRYAAPRAEGLLKALKRDGIRRAAFPAGLTVHGARDGVHSRPSLEALRQDRYLHWVWERAEALAQAGEEDVDHGRITGRGRNRRG